MIYTRLTVKALNIAYNAHHGQKDISGVPYIFHPYHIAEQMHDEKTVCVALLHDVVEDTEVTIEELEEEFPEDIVKAVRLLTHDENEDYYDYVRRICDNPIAKAVKLGDLRHNMDESRIWEMNEENEERIKRWKDKYTKAMEIIQGEE